MSLENTNTPNGDSKYINNEDTGKQIYNIIDMSQHDPAKDLTGNEPGDNTVSEVYTSIENTTIRDFGNVKIATTLVGQPMIDGPEAKSSIKLSIQDVKDALKAKGAIPMKDYIDLKKEKAEREEDKNKEIEEDAPEK